MTWASFSGWVIGGGGCNVAGSVDRFKVEFVSRPRRSDGSNKALGTEDMEWDYSSTQFGGKDGAPHETRTLTAIQIKSMPAATWELVREYRFGYDFSLYSDDSVCLTGPCSDTSGAYGPDPAYRKLTLTSLQVVGSDGTTALPAQRFSYYATNPLPQYVILPHSVHCRMRGLLPNALRPF